MAKSTHLILNYSVREDRIDCVCEEWSGPTEEFRQHQLHTPPTNKRPPEDPFKGMDLVVRRNVYADV